MGTSFPLPQTLPGNFPPFARLSEARRGPTPAQRLGASDARRADVQTEVATEVALAQQ